MTKILIIFFMNKKKMKIRIIVLNLILNYKIIYFKLSSAKNHLQNGEQFLKRVEILKKYCKMKRI